MISTCIWMLVALGYGAIGYALGRFDRRDSRLPIRSGEAGRNESRPAVDPRRHPTGAAGGGMGRTSGGGSAGASSETSSVLPRQEAASRPWMHEPAVRAVAAELRRGILWISPGGSA